MGGRRDQPEDGTKTVSVAGWKDGSVESLKVQLTNPGAIYVHVSCYG